MDYHELRDLAGDCVHCGFCLPACPTYSLWGEEMDSPRGRIHLVTQVLDGEELTPAAAEHFDRCLGCMACMTACTSRVQYDRLIEAARAWTDGPEQAAPHVPVGGGRHRPWRNRVGRAAIFAVFPYRERLRLLTGPLRGLQRTGLDRVVARTGLPSKLSPVLGAAMNLAPRPGPPVPRGRLPERVAARGQRRAVVGMLTGCVQSVFFGHVNVATARVLAAEGCDVVIPRQQECCGALSLHSGRGGEGADFARALIETFEQAGVEAIVVNSAGCGSAMKEYAELLADDPVWADRARALSAKVRDFSEFLAGLYERSGGPVAARHPVPARATYHDACHLGHAQGITAAPRQLLASVPDLEVREIPEAGMCCGSA